MTEEEKVYAKVLEFPKPKNDGGGTTIQFNYSNDAKCVFLTLAKQKSNTSVKDARFDYDNKIIVQMSAKDMASFLIVLIGKAQSINNDKGLYHQHKETTTTIKMKKNNPKYGGYYVSVCRSSGDKNNNIGVPITEEEAMTLGIYLRMSIEKIYN